VRLCSGWNETQYNLEKLYCNVKCNDTYLFRWNKWWRNLRLSFGVFCWLIMCHWLSMAGNAICQWRKSQEWHLDLTIERPLPFLNFIYYDTHTDWLKVPSMTSLKAYDDGNFIRSRRPLGYLHLVRWLRSILIISFVRLIVYSFWYRCGIPTAGALSLLVLIQLYDDSWRCDVDGDLYGDCCSDDSGILTSVVHCIRGLFYLTYYIHLFWPAVTFLKHIIISCWYLI